MVVRVTLWPTFFVALGLVAQRAHAEQPRIPSVPVISAFASECQCGSARCRCGTWLVQESDAFKVYCARDLADERRLHAVCEALRHQLEETWLGKADTHWSPKCVVVVHPSVRQYVAKLGRGSENSSGCASLEFENGKAVLRRIDLRSDADDW